MQRRACRAAEISLVSLSFCWKNQAFALRFCFEKRIRHAHERQAAYNMPFLYTHIATDAGYTEVFVSKNLYRKLSYYKNGTWANYTQLF